MLELIVEQSPLFFLIFVRIFTFLQISPLFSQEGIPLVVKTSFCLLLAYLVINNGILVQDYSIPENIASYVLLVLSEVVLGLIQGFIVYLLFTVLSMAGELFAVPMGFSASNFFDPTTQLELTTISHFFHNAGVLILLSSSALYKMLFYGIYRSFEVMNSMSILSTYDTTTIPVILKSLPSLFYYSFILALPILGVIFILYLTLGLLAKVAPQMNMLMMGFPLATSLGLLFLFVLMPNLLMSFSAILDNGLEELLKYLGQFQLKK